MTEYKIVNVGQPESVTGKSSFCIQFVQQNFVEEYDSTIEDSSRKQVNVDGQVAVLDILDTAGQDEYAAMREQYMIGGEGFLLIYSITSRNSFTEIREYHEQILRLKDVDWFPCVVVGNHCDRSDRQRKVSKEEGEELCKQLGVPFFEGSARAAINVEEAYYQLVREIRQFQQGGKKDPFKFFSSFKLGLKTGNLVIHNKELTNELLETIPSEYLSGAQLQKVDFKDCGLTEIPQFLAHCDPKKLRVIKLQGNPLSSSPLLSLVSGGATAKTLIAFAKQFLEPEKLEPFPEVKMMVLGDQAVGKTTLLQQLYKKKLSKSKHLPPTAATDGIELGQMEMGGVTFICWDFAGQEIYKYTHQLFISDNSLSLILFDVTKDQSSSSSHLLFWFDNVVSSCSSICLFIDWDSWRE